MTTGKFRPRLIILSDLWGKERSGWVKYYTKHLENYFEIQYYDSCELAEIDILHYHKELVHQQFINGGFDKAVKNLKIKEDEKISVLGFSIGGFIAWKAMVESLPAGNLFAVSSTRLRQEIQKPRGFIQLYYAENDTYRPTDRWFLTLNLEREIFAEEDHDFYQKENVGKLISQKIIQHFKNTGQLP